jgi:hypothetical protein
LSVGSIRSSYRLIAPYCPRFELETGFSQSRAGTTKSCTAFVRETVAGHGVRQRTHYTLR